MAARVAWQVAATAAVLSAVPLAMWQYQRYIELKERRDAIKLLRKVELVAAEVGVRLLYLETQTEEFVANQNKPQDAETEEDAAANSTLNSYYHFDSQGNKLKTKWDLYDVDAELERLEEAERGEQVPSESKARKPVRQTPQVSKSKLLSTAAGIEQEFEAVLAFLDDVRGDDEVKQLRKAIVSKVHKEHFACIDAIRTQLA